MSRRVCVRAILVVFAVIMTQAVSGRRVGLHLSDIHLDPYYGTAKAVHGDHGCSNSSLSPLGTLGCDAPLSLVNLALRRPRDALRKAEVEFNSTQRSVVYHTGDWLRHEMPKLPDPFKTAGEIMRTLAKEIADNFLTNSHVHGVTLLMHPAIPVSLGNEDFIPDYHFNVSEAGTIPLMNEMASILQERGFFDDDGAHIHPQQHLVQQQSSGSSASSSASSSFGPSANQTANFAYCGFARFRADPGALRVLGLNTLVYTSDMNPPTMEADPCSQFAWLTSELTAARAAGEKVHLLSHIPPVIAFWKSEFYSRYHDILSNYTDVVTAQFFGHIHSFSYGASVPTTAGEKAVAPVFIGGPVTPVSNTISDFSILPISDDEVVQDRIQWPLNFTSGQFERGLSFKEHMDLADLSPASLVNASRRMLDLKAGAAATAYFDKFYSMYEGGYVPAGRSCDIICRLAISCFTVAQSWGDALRECPSGILQSLAQHVSVEDRYSMFRRRK
jgi:sphingomyelin phosphodiesterase acid-like 3